MAGQDGQVGMTDTDGSDLDLDLAGLGVGSSMSSTEMSPTPLQMAAAHGRSSLVLFVQIFISSRLAMTG